EDANYAYYDHGPLARTELGDELLQGMDFTYTINGWIKGVNGWNSNGNADPGCDGKATGAYNGTNELFSGDLYNYQLFYHRNDYKNIANIENNLSLSDDEYTQLYNGNIAAMLTTIPDISGNTDALHPVLYKYGYDQLNRISGMSSFTIDGNREPWLIASEYSYDGAGNIRALTRKSGGVEFDRFSYHYVPGSNRLDHVADPTSPALSQNDLDGQQAGNYQWDADGNLLADRSEGISRIDWNCFGKMKHLTRESGSDAPGLTLRYNAQMSRLSKEVSVAGNPANSYSEVYVWDIFGNLQAVYRADFDATKQRYRLTAGDLCLYGMERLGTIAANKETGFADHPIDFSLTGPASGKIPGTATSMEVMKHISLQKGVTQYELTNHLGNVLVTITDRKIAYPDTTNPILIGHYQTDYRFTGDYWPFGMAVEERTSQKEYRFGFNGMEKDDEVIYVMGSHYTTEFREYDSRIGRWMSTDPAMRKYANWSPYVFSFNNPIWWNDANGADPDGDGEKRAEKAKEIDKKDTRSYGNSRGDNFHTDGIVDCSEFAAEVQEATGYTTGGTNAKAQAENFKKTGEWSDKVKDIQLGDQVFFSKGNGINHTAIVTEIDSEGNIYVTHATVNKNKPGSIKTDKLNSDGSIPYWNNTFVGTGRPIASATTTVAVLEKAIEIIHLTAKIVVNTATKTSLPAPSFGKSYF
ncbi:MAG: hypothetical protein KKA07_00835, partial [Bacteroidetes bacterium]|nr:hypothetical protein [Bacteroidota bacterium]MBU1717595.1 hypothetical protein [Bacteroidota bacterium]